MKVYFYHPIFAELSEEELLGLNNSQRAFTTGPHVWIVQTYVKLKLAGYSVEGTSIAPKSGILLIHSHHFFEFWNSAKTTSNIIVVSVRADRKPNPYADFEILQNLQNVDSHKRFFIPHWPQPGLIMRNTNRGTEIKTLAFKGFLNNLNDMFNEASWQDFAREYSLEWIVDAEPWKSTDANYKKLNWGNYENIDIIIAIRQDLNNQYENKPASKLTNSWAAGVPCLLGPEIAYRQLRKSNLDYIEVDSLDSVKRSILKLISDPNLYEAMISNGKQRVIQFSEDAITEAWGNLIFNVISKKVNKPHRRLVYFLPLTKRKYFN
ncbi:MAG: hypothetical protein ACJAXS_002786 [Colwellia sp.]|jgi:hypothetical protein